MKFLYAKIPHVFQGRSVGAKEFLSGGSAMSLDFDPATQGVAILDVFPDFHTQRCDDSNPLDVDREIHKKMAIRAATGQEITDYDNVKKDAVVAKIDTELAVQAIGKILLDKLDAAIGLINACRGEAAHTQRAIIPPIDRPQFWTQVKEHYRTLLP